MASTLNLSLEPALLDLVAGGEATVRISVKNLSQLVGQYQLSAVGLETRWFTFDPDQLGVFPGDSGSATLHVRPPAGVPPAAYPSVIRVINQDDTADEARALLKLNVTAAPPAAAARGSFVQRSAPALRLSITPSEQTAPDHATYTIGVSNPSQIEVGVKLSAGESESACRFQFSPASLTIPAGAAGSSTLTVNPLQFAAAPGQTHNFTVRAEPVGELLTAAQVNGKYNQTPADLPVLSVLPPSQSPSSGATNTVQVAKAPGFNFGRRLPILLGLILLLLLCGGAFLVLPPIGALVGGIFGDTRTVVTNLPSATPPAILFTATPAGATTRAPLPATPTIDPGPFTVKGVTARVSPTSASVCPAGFNFSADITVNRAGSVTYVWQFTNGISTPPKTINFSGPGTQTVTQSASFNANGPGGGHVKVTSPPLPDSNQATVVLTCPSTATRTPTGTPLAATATPTAMPSTVPPVPTIAGNWVHNFGTMNLAQSGSNVSGTYYNAFVDANGTIDGTLSGNVLNGNWHINGGSGTFQWTLAGQTFTGTWNGSVLWCGARAGSALQNGCGFSGPWNIRLEGGTRTMNMTQTGTSISGTYFNGASNGTVAGNVLFTGGQVILSGTWKVGASTGSLKFYMVDDNSNLFQGNYNTSFEWCGWRGAATQPSPCLK